MGTKEFWDMMEDSKVGIPMWGTVFDMLKIQKAVLTSLQNKKEINVNLSLLQRPKKVKAGTKTAFVYAPSSVTAQDTIAIGEAINIVDVFEGDTPEETTIKVMRQTDWRMHVQGYYQEDGEMMCTVRDPGYDRNENPCHCHMEPSEMPETFREKVHYVLLSDLGK